MEPSSHHLRLLTVGANLVCLVGLFVWAGTVSPDPALNEYPGNDGVATDPDSYAGHHVSLGATVVATDPVIVEVEYGIDERRGWPTTPTRSSTPPTRRLAMSIDVNCRHPVRSPSR